MTLKDFNNTKFTVGMKIKFQNEEIHELIGVDFGLKLFGIDKDGSIELEWYDINECELV